jgi:hypothetical protein
MQRRPKAKLFRGSPCASEEDLADVASWRLGDRRKAQERLHRKFTKLTYHRKPAGKVATAVARELVGFIWAIGHLVESQPAAKAT